MRLVIYPLYKIQKLQEKFYILKLNISPLDICIDLIEKKNLVKTQIIQHNYGCIHIEDIEIIEESVKSVIKDILNMNEKITILFKEINEVTKKIGEIPLIENEDFYAFFKNLNFLEKDDQSESEMSNSFDFDMDF